VAESKVALFAALDVEAAKFEAQNVLVTGVLIL
jgi:hypothetical protein